MYNQENPIAEQDVIIKKSNQKVRIIEAVKAPSKSSGAEMLTLKVEIVEADRVKMNVLDENDNNVDVEVDINGIQITHRVMLSGKDPVNEPAKDAAVKARAKELMAEYDLPNFFDDNFDPNMLLGRVLDVQLGTVDKPEMASDNKTPVINPRTNKPNMKRSLEIFKIWTSKK